MWQESLLLCQQQDSLLARGQGGNFSACLSPWSVVLEGRTNPDKSERLLLWKELTLDEEIICQFPSILPAHSSVGNGLVSKIGVGRREVTPEATRTTSSSS